MVLSDSYRGRGGFPLWPLPPSGYVRCVGVGQGGFPLVPCSRSVFVYVSVTGGGAASRSSPSPFVRLGKVASRSILFPFGYSVALGLGGFPRDRRPSPLAVVLIRAASRSSRDRPLFFFFFSVHLIFRGVGREGC